jgi:phosphoribulokinase
MSAQHPIIVVTGSSGAGTTSITRTFQWIFRRECISAVIVEGDSFHRYDRLQMRQQLAKAASEGNHNYSHFGPYSNLFV